MTKKITLIRKEQQLSQAALGRKARVHPSTVSLIESGRFIPGAGQLKRLARVLGFAGNPDSLLEDA